MNYLNTQRIAWTYRMIHHLHLRFDRLEQKWRYRFLGRYYN